MSAHVKNLKKFNRHRIKQTAMKFEFPINLGTKYYGKLLVDYSFTNKVRINTVDFIQQHDFHKQHKVSVLPLLYLYSTDLLHQLERAAANNWASLCDTIDYVDLDESDYTLQNQ